MGSHSALQSGALLFLVQSVISSECEKSLLRIPYCFKHTWARACLCRYFIYEKTFSPLPPCATLKNAPFLIKMKNFSFFRKKRQESFVCNEKVHTLAGQQ